MLTQRATVIVGEPRAAWLRDANDRLVGCRLLVTWHNVGSTPTRNMIAAVAGQATERPPPRTSAMPKADARQQPVIVGPNAAVNSAYVNLPIGLVADILARRAYYLFAGWAEYNDVFDRTPRHRVEFCYWLEFDGEPRGRQDRRPLPHPWPAQPALRERGPQRRQWRQPTTSRPAPR